MAAKYNLGFPEVPFSITNKTVSRNYATDVSSPFSLLEFIKAVSASVESSSITEYYNSYLNKWNSYRTSKDSNSNDIIVESYRGFIKELSLNYSSEAEKQFLSNIDYNDPYDMDVALSFISRKIKEIALYYSKKRESIKLETTRKKLKGSSRGIVITLKEKIIDLLTNTLDKKEGYSISDISKNLNVYVDELYDGSTTNLNKTPDANVYGANDIDYGLSTFFKSNAQLVASVFGGQSTSFQTNNEVSSIFTNKNDLTRKYMGADYYYASATPLLSTVPAISVDSKYNIIYNRQQIINNIIPTTTLAPCYCITAIGPVQFTYNKCEDGSKVKVTILSAGEQYRACAINGEVYDVSVFDNVTKGEMCSDKTECPPVEPPLGPNETWVCVAGKCIRQMTTGGSVSKSLCEAACIKGGAVSSGGGGGGGGGKPPSPKGGGKPVVCNCSSVIIETQGNLGGDLPNEKVQALTADDLAIIGFQSDVTQADIDILQYFATELAATESKIDDLMMEQTGAVGSVSQMSRAQLKALLTKLDPEIPDLQVRSKDSLKALERLNLIKNVQTAEALREVLEPCHDENARFTITGNVRVTFKCSAKYRLAVTINQLESRMKMGFGNIGGRRFDAKPEDIMGGDQKILKWSMVFTCQEMNTIIENGFLILQVDSEIFDPNGVKIGSCPRELKWEVKRGPLDCCTKPGRITTSTTTAALSATSTCPPCWESAAPPSEPVPTSDPNTGPNSAYTQPETTTDTSGTTQDPNVTTTTTYCPYCPQPNNMSRRGFGLGVGFYHAPVYTNAPVPAASGTVTAPTATATPTSTVTTTPSLTSTSAPSTS